MGAKYYFIIVLVGFSVYFIFSPKIHIQELEKNAVSETFELYPENKLKMSDNEAVKQRKVDIENIKRNISSTHDELINMNYKKINIKNLILELNQCLGFEFSEENEGNKFGIENLLNLVQTDLGAPVVKSQDWSMVETVSSNGKKKLIKIETSYEIDNIFRKLKYYDVTENGLIPIELTDEQSTEPSESLIASLEREGQVVRREKSERLFFENNEEINYTDLNGEIASIEFFKLGRFLKCKDLLNKKPLCQCR